MPMPHHAKKVFSGTIFDVYQWEQKLFDGTTDTFERLVRPDSAQVLAIRGDRIILSRQEQPDIGAFISSFGGRIERGEDPLTAAKRELLEESGMTSDSWSLWMTEKPFSKMEWHVHTFIARNCVKSEEPSLDAGERIEPYEVTFDEFLNVVRTPGFRGREIAFAILKRLADGEKEKLRQELFGE